VNPRRQSGPDRPNWLLSKTLRASPFSLVCCYCEEALFRAGRDGPGTRKRLAARGALRFAGVPQKWRQTCL